MLYYLSQHINRIVLIILFLSCVQSVDAQHRRLISILDKDSKDPVDRAVIMQGNDTIARSTPQGLVVIPTVKGKVVFAHRDYESREFDYDSIPSVVKMRCIVQELDEIVVLGRLPIKFDMKLGGMKLGESHYGIVKTTMEGSTMNLKTVRQKLFGRTRKEKKKDKLRKVLEEY